MRWERTARHRINASGPVPNGHWACNMRSLRLAHPFYISPIPFRPVPCPIKKGGPGSNGAGTGKIKRYRDWGYLPLLSAFRALRSGLEGISSQRCRDVIQK